MESNRIAKRALISLCLVLLLVAATVVASAQEIVLRWVTPGPAEEQAAYRAVADRFEELHPGIKVETGLNSSRDQMLVWIAAGTPPDIGYSTVQDASDFIRNGMVEPLDRWIERDGFDIEDFFPPVLAPYRFDGEKFGVGQLYGIPKESAVRATYYNVTLFEEAGLVLPPDLVRSNAWTWEAFREAARKLTRRSPSGEVEQWGFVRDARFMYQMMWVWANGGNVVDDLLNPTRITLHEPAAVEALEFYADMAWVDGSAPQQWTTGSGAAVPFTEGRAGLNQDGPWRMANFNANPNLVYGIVQSPMGKQRANLLSGSIFFIPKGVPNPDLSWELLKFISSAEAQAILAEVAGIQPARRSLVDTFVATNPNVDLRILLEEVNYAQTLFTSATMTEIDRVMNAEFLPRVANGEMSVVSMIETARPVLEAILREGR